MTGRGRDQEPADRDAEALADLSDGAERDAVGLTEALDPTTSDHVAVRRFTLRVIEGPDDGALVASSGDRLSIDPSERSCA